MGRSDVCKGAFGTTFASRRWLCLDPSGLVCFCLSLSIHIYALAIVSTHLISHSKLSQTIFGVLYCPAAALAVSSLLMAWTTDPGAVPMGARPLPTGGVKGDEEMPARRRGIRRCRKCNDNYKPPRAHHDSVTGRCIVKMDHFCPWVGNAVGALNHKFFFLFILYTLTTSAICLWLLVARFVRCGVTSDDDEDSSGGKSGGGTSAGNGTSPKLEVVDARGGETDDEALDPDMRRFLNDEEGSSGGFVFSGCENLFSGTVLVLLIVTVTFLFFTCCMLTEQIDAINSGTSKIARMKLRSGRATVEEGQELTRTATSFNEFFGGSSPNISWRWFVPTPVRFPEGASSTIMGYEYEPSWGDEPYREPDDDITNSGSTRIVAGGASASSLASKPPLPASEENEDEFEDEFAGGGGRPPSPPQLLTHSAPEESTAAAKGGKRQTVARKRSKSEQSVSGERAVPPAIV